MGEDPNRIHVPGDSLANKSATEGDDDGTLGCFAKTADGSVVLLSCAHVVFASIHTTNLSIYSPAPSSTCCRHYHIADALKTWKDGFSPDITIVVDPDPDGNQLDEQTGSETDCAIAKLRAGVLFSNEIPGIGMISGTPATGLGVPDPPDWGTPPTDDQIVRFARGKKVFFGTLMRPLSGGTIKGTSTRLEPLRWPEASGSNARDARLLVGGFVIMPRVDPATVSKLGHAAALAPILQRSPGDRLRFGREGDSGSVVVNSRNEVIGILCHAGARPERDEFKNFPEWQAVAGTGTVSPIGPVLRQMGITIPDNLAKTTHTAGEVYAYPATDDPAELALQRGQRRVGEQLQRSRLGKIILEKLERHRVEARRIVARERHVRAMWQRHHGPAFVNHCIRNLRDPAHRVPDAINGVQRRELLRVMADVLAAHGSQAMRRDIERYRELVLAHAPELGSLDDVAPAIARLSAR